MNKSKPAGRTDDRCSTCNRSAHYPGATWQGHEYTPSAEPNHRGDPADAAVCWLLDVRAYGLDIANTLHP